MRWSFAAAVLLLGAVSVAPAVTPSASAAPPPGVLASRYETATGRQLKRDCGFSAALPADPSQSLWLFCEIEEKDAGGTLLQFRAGTYASVGPTAANDVPAPLSELPAPPAPIGALPSNRAPERLLPQPTGLSCGGGTNYATTRATGMTRGPAGKLRLLDGTTPVELADASQVLLITYIEACVPAQGSLEIHPKRFGIAAYDPAANLIKARFTVFDGGGADLPWYQNLASPAFGDSAAGAGGLATGNLFLFASTCDTMVWVACTDGRVFLSRVRLHDAAGAGQLPVPASYQYWAKSKAGWLDDPSSSDVTVGVQKGWTTAALAESILPAGTGSGPLSAQANDFRWTAKQSLPAYTGRGEGFLLVEQTNLGGAYRVWQADTPTGRWTLKTSGTISCTVCGPMVGHPALSDPTHLVATQFRSGDREVEAISLGDPQVTSGPSGSWVTSNWERSGAVNLARECGWSAPLPANPSESLWLFCDMAPLWSSAAEARVSLYFGTFGAIGTSTSTQVPTSVSDITSPRFDLTQPVPTLPARPNNSGSGHFLQMPVGLCPVGVGLNYAWGVTAGPAGTMSVTKSNGQIWTGDGSQLLFIPYNDLCVTSEPGLAALHIRRMGIAIYEPATHTLLAQTTIYDPPGDTDVGWQQVLSAPVFSGDNLYLFSGHCNTFIDPYGANQSDKCTAGGTVAATRVPKNSIQIPAQYKWHTGAAGAGAWTTTDPTLATSIVPVTSPTRGPVGLGGTIYVGRFGTKGLLLIEPTSWLGHYRIWQAATPDGPWTLRRTEGAVMAGCELDSSGQPRTLAACYNFSGHPEFSTGDHLMVSHIQPDISTADDDTATYEAEVVDIGGADIPVLP